MKLCLLTLSLCLGWSVHAEQVYLLFAPECGQQIRYRRSVEEAPAADYYAYVFTDDRDGTRYLLETDGQGSGSRASLPASYLTCATAVLTSRLVDRINTGTDQLTILLASSDTEAYQVQPVVMATLLQTRGDEITFRSPLATFTFDTRLTVIGENIDRAGEGATVFFEGQEGSDCQRNYLFTQRRAGSAYPSITYRLSPTLGITQRALGGNGTYTKSEDITALEVNGLPLSTYLSETCTEIKQVDTAPPVTDFVPLYVESTAPPSTYVAPAIPATDGGTHRVAAGETLYRISQRHGVSVNTLKELNRLTSNTIRVGQELLLEEQNSISPIQMEAPQIPPVSSSVVSTDYHVVQAGETIASLALRFGYTEARFREFNGIEEQRVALVGQQLKTSDCDCPVVIAAPQTEPLLASAEAPQSTTTYAPLPPPPPTSRPDYTPIVIPPARPLLTGATEVTDLTAAETAAPLPPAYGGGRTVHVVQEGQSLYAIAQQYGVSVTDLQQLNGLGPSDVIVPFQKLYVN